MTDRTIQLQQRLSALSEHQRRLLAEKLAQCKPQSAQPQPIVTAKSSQLVAYVVPDASIAGQNLSDHDLSTLKAALTAKLPAYVSVSAVVPLAALPRTASGKIDVNALPAPMRSPSRQEASRSATPTEQTLIDIWQAVLGVDPIGIHDNFFELGGDSILSIQIVSRAREAGLRLAPNQLFDHPTVAELAQGVNAVPEVVATQTAVTGEVPLSPIQHWFFEQALVAPQHWHQARLFALPGGVGFEQVKEAIAALWHHHDALRMQFIRNSDCPAGWQQINAAAEQPPTPVQTDLRALGPNEQRQAVTEKGQALYENISLAAGLLQAVYFTRDENQSDWLLMSLHHLIVDVVSWQILQSDLRQLLLKPDAKRPEKTTAFKTWAEMLSAQLSQRKKELPFWIAQLSAPSVQIPQDIPCDLPTTEGSVRTLTVSLDSETTSDLLQQVPAAYGTQINDVLLTALSDTFVMLGCVDSKTDSKPHSIRLDVESHGREHISSEIDLSRTVGWFTSTYPLGLQLMKPDSNSAEEIDLGERIKFIKEQLRQVPDRGIGYGLLRYLSDEATRQTLEQKLEQFSPAEVLFNYLGQQRSVAGDDSLQPVTDIDLGALRDPRNQRCYRVEINAYIANEQLHFHWTYDTQRYHSDTMEQAAYTCLNALQEIIHHCVTVKRGGFTPSDFPDVGFDQRSLDRFLAQLPETVHANLDTLYPLAPLQAAFLWHSLQTSAQAGLLHMRGTLHGDLDIALLKQAWQQVAAHHAVLRSSVHWVDIPQPLQLAQRQVELPWLLLDWRGKTAGELDGAIADFLARDRAQSFILTQAPITRLTLIRTGESTHELVWTCHHLMLDGWSGTVVINEVLDGYDFLIQGKSLALPPTTTFQDYICWQQQQDPSAAQDFWQTYLKATSSHAGKFNSSPFVAKRATPSLYASPTHLLPFLRTHQLTFNTLIQATWALLLYSRHAQTGRAQTDILFGTTVSGRQADLPGVESTVGLLINVLPVRVTIESPVTVLSWLQSLQQQQASASRYAYASLSQIQSWSGCPHQLFDTLLVIENYPVAHPDTARSLRIENLRSGIVSTYGLTMVVKPGEAPAFIAQSPSLDKAALDGVVNDFQALLHQITNNPALPLQQILPTVEVTTSDLASETAQPDQTFSTLTSSDQLPRNVLELKLIDIWQSVLGLSSLTAEESFFDLGGNSLLAVQLFDQMKQQLDCTLPLATLFQAPTVRQLAALLSQEQPPIDWSSLVPIRSTGSRLPFFFHGGSADALTWARFSEFLGEDQPFYALQRPDLDGSDIVHDTIESLAIACIQEMKAVQPEGPYVIGGHCFGGAVAFEIAQQLTRNGDAIATLIEIDAYCPNAVSHTALTHLQEQLQLATFSLRKAHYYHGGKNLIHLPKKLTQKLKQRLLPSIAEHSHAQSVTEGVDSAPTNEPPILQTASYQELYARAHQSSDTATNIYQPQPYAGAIHLFRAQTQILDWHYGPALGWQKIAPNQVTLTTIPGLFGNLFNQHALPLLAQQVKTHLSHLPPL